MRVFLTTERGPVDLEVYEDFRATGEVSGFHEFKCLWFSLYPEEVSWHEVLVVRYRNTLYIHLDKWQASIELSSGETMCNCSYNVDELLNWLTIRLVGELECILQDTSEYNLRLKKSFPKYCCAGRIRRKVLWEVLGVESFQEEFGVSQLQELLEHFRSKSKQGPENMCLGDFLSLCEICYDSNGYFKGREHLSPRQKYLEMADGRHDGLLDLEDKDAEAFRDWYHNRKKIGHPWEICRGGTYTQICLAVHHCVGTWTVWLNGLSRSRAIETARMVLALYRKEKPFTLVEGETLLNMLAGEDYVGVVPRSDLTGHGGGRFPSEDQIVDFINPWFEMREIVDHVEWYDIDKVKVKET